MAGLVVHYGPIEGPGATSDARDDDADWASGTDGSSRWMSFTGKDIDGDGLDNAMAVHTGDHPDRVYSIYFRGRFHPAACTVSGTDATKFGVGGSVPIGDGDGDGIPELLVNLADHSAVVSGADTRDLCSVEADDLAIGQHTDTSVRYGLGDVGDLTGDGISEFVPATRNTDPEEDAWYFWSAGDVVNGDFDIGTALGSYLVLESGQSLYRLQTPSFDGSGVPNLLFSTPWIAGTVHLLRGGVVPALHEPFPSVV